MNDILTRLDNHIALMAPHQKEREAGKLLIDARAAIALERTLARSEARAKVERGNMLITEQEKTAALSHQLADTKSELESVQRRIAHVCAALN